MIRFLIRSFLIGLALIWFNTIMISPSLAADQVTNLTSSSHQISERSNNNEITVTWDASGITDLDGFAYEWTNDSATIPADRNLGSDASTVTSDSLADGTWYFHIRPVLTASPFYGTTSHLGPFIIVTVPVGDDWSPKSPKPRDSVTLSGFNLKEGLQISFYADSGMTNLKKATASNIFIISGDETHATFTVPQNLAPGTYYLKLKNTDGKTGQVAGFEVTSAKVLDVDGDGRQDALTDGLLIIRYLFGFRGADLIRDAVGVGATRTSATEIEDYIKNSLASLDIDNNQTEDALTDGLLIIRYLFGFRGTDLIRDAVGVGATRTSATEIEDYIESLK